MSEDFPSRVVLVTKTMRNLSPGSRPAGVWIWAWASAANPRARNASQDVRSIEPISCKEEGDHSFSLGEGAASAVASVVVLSRTNARTGTPLLQDAESAIVERGGKRENRDATIRGPRCVRVDGV